MNNRKSIPSKTKKTIFKEAQSRCPFCGEESIDTLEIHHILEKSLGGTDTPENLILVCSNCHSKITAGAITNSDVLKKKQNLSSEQNMKPSKTEAKIFNISTGINTGIIGETVTIKNYKGSTTKILPPEGAIASNLHMRNYVKRLIDRYNEFKKADKNVGNFKYSIIYGAINREFKCKWDLVPVNRFEELVEYLKMRIDKTILGKAHKSRGQKNYSTFEEYLREHNSI